MIKMGTNSTTIRIILAHIRAWLEKKSPPDTTEIVPEASTALLKTIEDQKIGWDQQGPNNYQMG
jgi:hypothetical protein